MTVVFWKPEGMNFRYTRKLIDQITYCRSFFIYATTVNGAIIDRKVICLMILEVDGSGRRQKKRVCATYTLSKHILVHTRMR